MAAVVVQETAQIVVKQVAKQAAKEGGKRVGAQILKAIPFVGLTINGVLAVRQFAQGNIVNGLVDLGQGVVSVIPGAGVGLSIVVAVAGQGIKQVTKHIKNKK